MYTIEVHPTCCRILATFYECGYWRSAEEDEVSTVRTVGTKLFYSSMMILFQSVIIICAWISDDNSESLFLAQVEIFTIVMTVKWIYLVRHKDTILFYLSDSIVTHSISDYEVFVLVKKKIKKFMNFVHVYLTTLALVVFMLVVSPLPIFSSNKQLPMFINYSLNCDYSELIYWIIYSPLALQIFLIFVINLLTVIIWYVMLNCSIKYLVLGNQLANLGVPRTTITEDNQVPECKSFDQEFIDLVEAHLKIFELIEQFKSSFSCIFMAQIATSCISICSSNFVLAYSSHYYFLIQLAAFTLTFLYGIVNIFVVMYLGHSIKFESSRLLYCLFQSNWIEQSESAKKGILIMGEALQRPHELVIFKLFPMNLLTFATIVNFAIASYSLLRNLCLQNG